MTLQDEVEAEKEAIIRITAVATLTSCPCFCDILWGEIPDIITLVRNPGVMFESHRRVVVFQRITGELRYFAGGWCSDESQIHVEQERIASDGHELGVFTSVSNALAFAEKYLVDEMSFQAIDVSRCIVATK